VRAERPGHGYESSLKHSLASDRSRLEDTRMQRVVRAQWGYVPELHQVDSVTNEGTMLETPQFSREGRRMASGQRLCDYAAMERCIKMERVHGVESCQYKQSNVRSISEGFSGSRRHECGARRCCRPVELSQGTAIRLPEDEPRLVAESSLHIMVY